MRDGRQVVILRVISSLVGFLMAEAEVYHIHNVCIEFLTQIQVYCVRIDYCVQRQDNVSLPPLSE